MNERMGSNRPAPEEPVNVNEPKKGEASLMTVRADILITALGIPHGRTSALRTQKKRKVERRVNPESDRVIAEKLTNLEGVSIDSETGIISLDFRDLLEEGFPPDLLDVLDERTHSIILAEFEHRKDALDKYEISSGIGIDVDWLDEEDENQLDMPIHFFYLPGGIPVFLKGYYHTKEWHSAHAEHLKEMTKQAEILCIEGFPEHAIGKSLPQRWSDPNTQRGHYDVLIKEAVEAGFIGLFAEVDARDQSKELTMDQESIFGLCLFPLLPEEFFRDYYQYLEKENPPFAEKIRSPDKLKLFLHSQSTAGVLLNASILNRRGVAYMGHSYTREDFQKSPTPTGLELGQLMFTDALAALKLHMIARLMADGHIGRGPIVDFEGAAHLSSKSFFIQHPLYAAEVVLRTINELMAGTVTGDSQDENFEQIREVFKNPNWEDVIRKITELPFFRVEDDDKKTVGIGPNQKKMIKVSMDYLAIYGIDPKTLMPLDVDLQKSIDRMNVPS